MILAVVASCANQRSSCFQMILLTKPKLAFLCNNHMAKHRNKTLSNKPDTREFPRELTKHLMSWNNVKEHVFLQLIFVMGQTSFLLFLEGLHLNCTSHIFAAVVYISVGSAWVSRTLMWNDQFRKLKSLFATVVINGQTHREEQTGREEKNKQVFHQHNRHEQ